MSSVLRALLIFSAKTSSVDSILFFLVLLLADVVSLDLVAVVVFPQVSALDDEVSPDVDGSDSGVLSHVANKRILQILNLILIILIY